MPTHKQEALRAIAHVQKALEGPEPLEGLPRRQLAASVAYAAEEVEKIQELKRVRRQIGVRSAP